MFHHSQAKHLQAITGAVFVIMSMHLFAYGTLMCVDIMHKVSACRPAHAPATLGNYRRCRVDGEVYPGVVGEQGGLVPGLVYFDVPAEAWARLDAFEGEMYCRRTVLLTGADVCGDEISLEAETYVDRKSTRLNSSHP